MAEQRTEEEPRTPTCRLVRNEAALITEVEESIVEILGWRPDQILGSPPTALVHPDDLARAVGAWFSMMNDPGSTQTWRGRFRTADGGWCWIEAHNTNRLDDPEDPGIFTVIRPAEADSLDLEEELRAREELIARLTDAMPVGAFQVDRDRRMLFTNGRLHHILGTPPVGDLASQFSAVADDDRPPTQRCSRSSVDRSRSRRTRAAIWSRRTSPGLCQYQGLRGEPATPHQRRGLGVGRHRDVERRH